MDLLKKKNPEISQASGGSFPNIIQLRMLQSEEFERINISEIVEKFKNNDAKLRLSYVRENVV